MKEEEDDTVTRSKHFLHIREIEIAVPTGDGTVKVSESRTKGICTETPVSGYQKMGFCTAAIFMTMRYPAFQVYF